MYCTADQILELLAAPGVTAWAETADPTSTPTESAVADIITANSRIIDGFCRGRYTVPWSPVPEDIARICLALSLADVLPAVFRGDKSQAQHDRAERERKFAMDLLKSIQAGEYSVTAGDDASENVGGAPVIVSTPATNRIFSVEDYH